MTIPAEIFRAYDIRGIVGRTLTPAYVREIGRALGTLGRERGAPTFAVGRDGRHSGPELAGALGEGLAAAGADVIELGMVPTPVTYFAAHHLGCGSCVSVTGSHNPPDYNGLKLVVGGVTLAGDEIQALRRRIESGPLASGSGKRSQADVLDAYVERIAGDVRLARPLKIAVDCGNGVAGLLVPRLYRRLGCEVEELYCEVDGDFPNHHPDPSQLENLTDLIARLKHGPSELGLAFDGDGDRIGAVDGRGRILWADQLMMLFAEDVLHDHPGATVIADVKSSQALFDEIARRGGVPLMWKTGHSLIKSKMAEVAAPLAGEMSGHIFFADRYFGFDDGLYAAVRLLALLERRQTNLAALYDQMPVLCNTPELRFPCAEDRKFAVIDEVAGRLANSGATVSTIDGLRVNTADGWWLLRASNTQDVLVARCEAGDEAGLERLKQALSTQLEQSGLALPEDLL